MARPEDKMVGYCGYNCHLCELGQMILALGKNWLMRGENTLVISIIQQKMSPAKDVRVKVIKSRISNAKRDLAQERKVLRAVLNAMNSRARK
jgi:hypothetical protein